MAAGVGVNQAPPTTIAVAPVTLPLGPIAGYRVAARRARAWRGHRLDRGSEPSGDPRPQGGTGQVQMNWPVTLRVLSALISARTAWGRDLTEHFGPLGPQFVLAEGSQCFNLGSDLSFLVHGRIGVSKDRRHQAARLLRSHSRRSSSRLARAATSSGFGKDGVVRLTGPPRHYQAPSRSGLFLTFALPDVLATMR
jgi:hypothetical protein